MRVKSKLALALGILSLIVLVMGIFAISSINRLDTQNQIYTALSAADNALYQARLGQADYMLTDDSEFADVVDEEIGNALQSLERAKENMEVAESVKQVAEIQRLMRQYKTIFDELVEVVQSNAGFVARAEVTTRLLDAAVAASSAADILISKESDIAEAVRGQVKTALVVAVIIGLVTSLALAIWLTRSILIPLQQSSEIADVIAKGDLTYSAQIEGNDEFASLNRALLGSIRTLNETVCGIKASQKNLSDISDQVVNAVDSSTRSMDDQQSQTDQLAAALQEMAASTSEIAQSASRASESSDQAEQLAAKGDQVINRSQHAMQALSDEMERAAEVVSTLNSDSKSIASILQVIRDIAEQTNLLALNAAIEAARAGEQGRGFAVVADEVRQLAKRTQDSTAEITQIVEMIQRGAANVVEVIDNSNSQSKTVVTLTEDASAAYVDISKAVNQLNEIISSVAVGAEQQSQVSEEVSRNVEAIKNLAATNSNNLVQISVQSDKQRSEAKTLNKLVDFFTV